MLLHDEVMFILTGIVFFVLWVLLKALIDIKQYNIASMNVTSTPKKIIIML